MASSPQAWSCCTSPLVWLVLASFKNRVDIFATSPVLFFRPTIDNYVQAFADKGFAANLVNSVIVAIVSSAVALVVGVLSAYSLSRKSGRLVDLSARPARRPATAGDGLGPPAVHPGYPTGCVRHLSGRDRGPPHVRDSLHGLDDARLLPGRAASLDEAARIDGCSESAVFLRIVLPLARGGLVATAIFLVINSWNEFLFALILPDATPRPCR